MNHSAKKQHHEQTRKKHKQQEHAREAAKRGPSRLPLILLVAGIAVVVAFVVFMSTR